MFTRTQWRVATWNDQDVQLSFVFGGGFGFAEIGLNYSFDNSRYTLYGTGISGSFGVGVDIMGMSIPMDDFGIPEADIRTAGGTLYKNDLLIDGELTIDHFRDTFVLVRGIEADFGTNEGACYYMLQVHSPGALAGSVATGGIRTHRRSGEHFYLQGSYFFLRKIPGFARRGTGRASISHHTCIERLRAALLYRTIL